MTRISFYILNGNSPDQRQAIACRLAEKAYLEGHQVFIHTGSAQHSTQIDAALWSFRPDSFVPHALLDADDNDSPVLIGHEKAPPRLMDIMINLSDQQPLFFSQFERVLEIIDDNEQVKQAGRERYRFYRQRGYELDTTSL